jgi:hypothetical protein
MHSREKRDHRLILAITIPIAIVFLLTVWFGIEVEKDEEIRPRENADTVQLVTLADSVHYYEDGY